MVSVDTGLPRLPRYVNPEFLPLDFTALAKLPTLQVRQVPSPRTCLAEDGLVPTLSTVGGPVANTCFPTLFIVVTASILILHLSSA